MQDLHIFAKFKYIIKHCVMLWWQLWVCYLKYLDKTTTPHFFWTAVLQSYQRDNYSLQRNQIFSKHWLFFNFLILSKKIIRKKPLTLDLLLKLSSASSKGCLGISLSFWLKLLTQNVAILYRCYSVDTFLYFKNYKPYNDLQWSTRHIILVCALIEMFP